MLENKLNYQFLDQGLYQKEGRVMGEFYCEKITDHITRIISPFQVCMYLIVGDRRAVLLDTGFGVGSLKNYVDSLTDRPYDVIISHGHLDHAGGAGEFEHAFLNKRDWELEKYHCTDERRFFDVYHGSEWKPKKIEEADFIPFRTQPYQSVDEGMNFDLGKVSLKPIAMPGHSLGSLIFLIPEDCVCITGDALGEHTLLQFQGCASIEEYKNSLIHLHTFESEFDIVLRNHGSYVSDKSIVEDSIELCEEILAHKDAAIPITFHGIKGMMGRPENHLGKAGNIIYNPDNLY